MNSFFKLGLGIFVSCVALVASPAFAQQQNLTQSSDSLTAQDNKSVTQSDSGNKIRRIKLGEIEKAFSVGSVILAGQPERSDFQTLQRAGVKRVVNLYRDKNSVLNETEVCRELNLEYQHVPFDDESQLNDSIFNTVRLALLESNSKPVFVHCKSNDRVGAVWAAYRTLDQGIGLEVAILEAKAMGLKTAGYERKLRSYVARMLNSVPLATPLALPGSS